MAKCEWAHLADHAFFDQQNKFCIIGIFDVIKAARVPATHPHASLAFLITGYSEEIVKARVLMYRPDGKDPLFDIKSPDINLGQAGKHQALIGINGLSLPDYGPYEVQIHLNGQLDTKLGLTVQRIKPKE